MGMPSLNKGKDQQPGIRVSNVTDMNGAQTAHFVPAVFALSGIYPQGADGSDATPVTAGSGNVANAVATATLPAVAAKTAYITGFDIVGAGATAAAIVNPTVTGIISGTRTYVYGAVAGVTAMNPNLSIQFNPPIPASAVNTAIVVSCPALGAGNTNMTVTAYGFYSA